MGRPVQTMALSKEHQELFLQRLVPLPLLAHKGEREVAK